MAQLVNSFVDNLVNIGRISNPKHLLYMDIGQLFDCILYLLNQQDDNYMLEIEEEKRIHSIFYSPFNKKRSISAG